MTMTDTVEAPPSSDAPDAVEAPPAPTQKRRSNLVPALVLAVGMVGAAFLLKPAPGGAAAEDTTTTTVAAGPVVPIEPMTLNLSDGRLIRIGLAIELTEAADAAKFEEHGSTNLLKDLVIFEVARLSPERVGSPEGLDELKATLSQGAHELYGEEFHGLYLTDLVVSDA